MPTTSLEIPGTPPSLNAIGYRSHWAVGRRHKQQWEQWIATALMVAKVPRGLERVSASAAIHFKQRRRRDEGNFRAILEKACGDALVAGGWLDDDTPDRFRFGAVDFLAPAPQPETILTIEYER